MFFLMFPNSDLETDVFEKLSFDLTIGRTSKRSFSLNMKESFLSSLSMQESFLSSLSMKESFPSSLSRKESFPSSLSMQESFPSSLSMKESFPSSLSRKESFPSCCIHAACRRKRKNKGFRLHRRISKRSISNSYGAQIGGIIVKT